MSKYYDGKYGSEEFYWGKRPSSMARKFFQKYPPEDGEKLLDIGCGEGRDSIFFSQNGYQVTGFDSSVEGIKKSTARADELNLSVDFFQADINEHRLQDSFDAIFASGALHYIPLPLREEIITNYQQFTNPGGIHAFMVPIYKPFLPEDPQADQLEQPWLSGEILTYYHDWIIEFFTEEILDDIRTGYQFPVNRLIARQPSAFTRT
jgi:tellurite methyltransferase